MNQHRRGELVTDPRDAVAEIQGGHPLMHNTCVLSAAQIKTWPVAKLLQAVQFKRLYTVMRLPT
ncbi:hypothetical protein [Geobacter sp. SVR]|uniref:hypothetical protein n=1 Tax=Geobacter sp. SVR TaxID=2495594 RepID=UPI00143EF55B|nr:hypothetical protein [Geobacter sp. SVR]BCS55177.1 hypothetical protein GSVR_34850 [Geobacter sp. SVR]GCF85358.1 hypothetical protein GSbR_19580 [Geobacter sp. SVR]